MTRLVLPLLVIMLAGCEVIDAAHPTVAEVQSIGVRECAFLPTEETAERIIAARPMWSNDAIADAVCAAVKTAKRGSVGNVGVEGLFVRKVHK